MLAELNPFGLPIIVAFVGSVGLFYLVGAMLVSNIQETVLSIGLRVALGSLFVVAGFATFGAGGHTGMFFYVLLFGWMLWMNKARFDYMDVKRARKSELIFLFLLAVSVLAIEALRSDLRVTNGVYVGNEDASFYSSFGHSLWESGLESNPENKSPHSTGIIYHFGDLWFSGLYSNSLSILPYYAYMILYRSLAVFAISVMVIGWVKHLTGRYSFGVLSVFLVLGAVYLELVPVHFPDLSLFKLFTCYYPIYGAGPYLIVGVGSIAFSVLVVEKDWVIGSIGLVFIALLNGGLIIASAIAGSLVFAYLVLSALRKKKSLVSALVKAAPLFIAGCLPFGFYAIDGRFESSGVNLLSFEYLYLVSHTFVRACISQLFVLPYLFGLLLFSRSTNRARKLVLIHVIYWLGTLFSTAIIFPLVQGNSGQIPSIHFTGMLAPICIVGLMSSLMLFKKNLFKTISIVVLLAVGFQSARIAMQSEYFLVTYDWSNHVSGYKEKSTVPIVEWTRMRELVSEKEVTRFGYFICDSLEGGGVHYNEFTYLKSVLPGAVFHRMNALRKDTMLSREMQAYYYRTSLGFFSKKYGFRLDEVEEAHMSYLKPDYLFTSKGSDKYCVPIKWTKSREPICETTNYSFYGQ